MISYYTNYDEMNRLTGRLDAYTGLQVYKDESDSTAKELSGRVSNLITKLSTDTAFALPELFANGSDFLDKVAGDVRMKPYLTWFNRDRAQSTHALPEAQEQLLQPLYHLRDGAYSMYDSLTGSDLTFSNIRFPDGSEREANENNYSAAYNKDDTQVFRIAYYNAMMQPYNQFRNTLAQNMQNYYTAVTKSAASHKYSSALEADSAPEDTPMSVYSSVLSAADQASSLNELLLSDYLMENDKTEEDRQYYAAQQISMLYSTFFTQTFFSNFQEAMVREVENGGTLTADKLDELWLQTTRDCFGSEYAVTDTYAAGWARIPHFYNGFYVYQYAVGIAAACNIAERLQSGKEGVAEDYLAFRKAGDSGNVVEMLRLAGVDIENSGYIDAFTSRFDRLITAFEEKQ